MSHSLIIGYFLDHSLGLSYVFKEMPKDTKNKIKNGQTRHLSEMILFTSYIFQISRLLLILAL